MYTSKLASTTLVSQSSGHVGTKASSAVTKCDATTATQPTSRKTSTPQEAFSASMPLIREQLNNTKISTAAQEIMMASWRTGTSKQCHTYLSRWKRFCDQRQINHSDASVENGIDFLALLFQDGLGYSTINSAAQHCQLFFIQQATPLSEPTHLWLDF